MSEFEEVDDRLAGADEIRRRYGIPRYYTVAELSKLFGVSASVIYRDIKDGTLRAKVPRGAKRGYRVCEDDIAQWLRDRMEYIA